MALYLIVAGLIMAMGTIVLTGSTIFVSQCDAASPVKFRHGKSKIRTILSILIFLSALSVAICGLGIGYTEYSHIRNTQVKVNHIYIEPSGNYILRETINSIKDNSANNRYVIHLSPGEYFEMDIIPKNFVDVVGQRRDACRIFCTYESEELTPEGLIDRHSGKSLGGISVNSLNPVKERNSLHIVFFHGDVYTVWKNLTFEVTGFAYAVHQDSDGMWDATFENCRFISNGGRCVGIGAKGGQYMSYINCSFENNIYNGSIDDYCIGFHNWNNQDAGSGLTLRNCVFNRGILEIYELGSDHEDVITLESCLTLSKEFSILVDANNYFYRDKNGNHVEKEELPYCINLYTGNSVFNHESVQTYFRPDLKF